MKAGGPRARAAAGGIGLVVAWLVSPHLYGEFSSARDKVIRTAVRVTSTTLQVPVSTPAFASLHPPFAAISRIRNDAASTLVVTVALDDVEVCRDELAPGTSRRIDCRVPQSLPSTASHAVVFTGSTTPYTVEYFELATHYGALSPGPANLIVAPKGVSGFREASRGHVLIVALLVALSVTSLRHTTFRWWLSGLHRTTLVIVGSVIAIVIAAESVSPYALLIQYTFLERLLALTALPALASGAIASFRWLRRPEVYRMAASVTAGLVVGGVFIAYAAHRVQTRYQGNVSGLVLISHWYFDKDPLVSNRQDIRQRLFFDAGGGSDGQFYYLNTFDPFLSSFRNEPRRYGEFIDAPPYRYGRIGFSLLTRVLSLGRAVRYPAMMVAIVIGALTLAGVLLGRIAQHHGLNGWYGLLIVLVPGFWQSVESAMPEPLAIALILGGYLCARRQNWWACGMLLGAAMLVRETSGILVLAIPATIALGGRRRDAATVTFLAFLPIVLWKIYLGWIFWPVYGADSVFLMPNNTGLPFAGVTELWRRIHSGSYFGGNPDAARAGISCALLTTAAAALGITAAIRRFTPFAVAAGLYGLLTITYNYDGVWLHMSQAQRLTVDLFVALALVFLQLHSRPIVRAIFVLFWIATAWHVFYGALESADARASLLGASSALLPEWAQRIR